MSNIATIENGLLLLLGTHVLELSIALLLLLLIAAVIFDVRSHRIPNWLVLSGLLVAIAFHTFMSYGWGIGYALKGAAVGLGAFLPLYLLRGMGAGDVKLMAMVGAFVGPASALGAVLMTLMVGGVLALGVALWTNRLLLLMQNLSFMLNHSVAKAVSGASVDVGVNPSAGKLPYALAIAVGAVTQVVLAANGNALVG